MPQTQDKVRLHRFHDLVAIGFTDCPDTLYMTPEMADSLSRELRQFVKHSKGKDWIATRTIDIRGKAITEHNGKVKREFVA